MALRTISGGSDLQKLDRLLREENHPMVNPTHVIERNGEIVGAIGLDNCIPLQLFLSKNGDSSKKSLDMLEVFRFVKSYCDSISTSNLLLHIGPESAGWKIMEKLGAEYIGTGHYWHYE